MFFCCCFVCVFFLSISIFFIIILNDCQRLMSTYEVCYKMVDTSALTTYKRCSSWTRRKLLDQHQESRYYCKTWDKNIRACNMGLQGQRVTLSTHITKDTFVSPVLHYRLKLWRLSLSLLMSVSYNTTSYPYVWTAPSVFQWIPHPPICLSSKQYCTQEFKYYSLLIHMYVDSSIQNKWVTLLGI